MAMKQFSLEEAQRRTLLDMGMWHPHPRYAAALKPWCGWRKG
jgi:hypothetical protein